MITSPPQSLLYANMQTSIPEDAMSMIFSQDVQIAVRKTAWLLYQHEIGRHNNTDLALRSTLEWIEQQKAKQQMKRLSPLQKQIVYLMAVEGLTRKQIAERTNRSMRTIEIRCRQIRKRLGLTSMYQVIALAVHRGWVGPPVVDD